MNPMKITVRTQYLMVSRLYAVILTLQGINDTAGDLYHTVTREHDYGVARTLGDVLRQVLGVAVRPILIASEATRHVLGGVRNQLMPDA